MPTPRPNSNPNDRIAQPVRRVYDPERGGVWSAQQMLRALGAAMPSVRAARSYAAELRGSMSTGAEPDERAAGNLLAALNRAENEVAAAHKDEVRRMRNLAQAIIEPDGNRGVFYSMDIRTSNKHDARMEGLARIDARASYWTPAHY